MKKLKLKGTFCFRWYAVFCGWLNSMSKHYVISGGEFRSAFTEKRLAGWNEFSAQSARLLLKTTEAQRRSAQALIVRKRQLEMMTDLHDEPAGSKRMECEMMTICSTLQDIHMDLALKLLDTKEQLLEATGKYQKILVSYYCGLHKRFPNNGSRTEHMLITQDVEKNRALQLYEQELAVYNAALEDFLNKEA